MFNYTIDRSDSQPLYQQIAEQVKTQISNGRLPANARLPTVRKMAQALGVTRLTVQNAYAELQADGWTVAIVGRGTFVCPSVQPISLVPSIGQYLTPDSAISDMLQIDQVVGVRSMALAVPDSALFPADEFWNHVTNLRAKATALMSYGPIQGDTHLRVELVRLLAKRGITAVPEDLIITSGAMQALSLVAQALTTPGESVLVESPTFLGMLNVLKAQYLNPISVPMQEDGPTLEKIERAFIEHKPRLFYTVPNFHNPTGICMSSERRAAVLALAKQHDCYILEDDIYGLLNYDTAVPRPLKVQDDGNRVIYLSSFSKQLMPGLRIGYVHVPPWLRTRMLTLRRATDLCGPVFVQRALADFLRDGGLKRHLNRVRPIYRERRDTLIEALRQNMPSDVTWTHPAGGFSAWVTMPRYFAPGELYRTALDSGFAFTPGEAYQTAEPQQESLRLCFGNQTPHSIQAGVKLLGQLIKQQLTRGSDSEILRPVV